MANPTATPTKAPATKPLPTDPKPAAPQPETPAQPAKPRKREQRPVQQIVWPTAEAAKAEAEKRTYGPRKAFTVSIGDTTVHCVAYDEKCAAYEAFVKAGGNIEELGGASRGKKPPSKESILASMQALPADQLAALKEQLAKL